MAKRNPATPARPMNFSTVDGLYQLSPTATEGNIHDQLCARLSQLDAMLKMISDPEGIEAFDAWVEDVRIDYLWACRMTLHEARELHGALLAA